MSSLIDYCIISTELLPRIEIGQLDTCLSDAHCPICIKLWNNNSCKQSLPDTLYDKPEDFVEIESNFTERWDTRKQS